MATAILIALFIGSVTGAAQGNHSRPKLPLCRESTSAISYRSAEVVDTIRRLGVMIRLPAGYVRKRWDAVRVQGGESVDYWRDNSPQTTIEVSAVPSASAFVGEDASPTERRCVLETESGRAELHSFQVSDHQIGLPARMVYVVRITWLDIDASTVQFVGTARDEGGRREQIRIARSMKTLEGK